MDALPPTPDPAEFPERGMGSGCAPEPAPPPDGTRDIRLLAMALERRWPMSPAARASAVARLERVLLDPDAKERAFYRALRALTSLDRVSLEALTVAIRAKLADGPAAEDTLVEVALRLRERQREGRA